MLLLSPLCAVPEEQKLDFGIADVLSRLTVHDARAAYEAIRLARPGGLGEVAAQDVQLDPTLSLLEVMRMAAHRDLIAAQYANGFDQVFWGASLLNSAVVAHLDWEQAVIMCHLELMANFPDTLIARKRGLDEAREAARRAAVVLAAEWPATALSRQQFIEFDTWLRAAGHARNPGSTADLVAASLFVVIRNNSQAIA